MTESPSEHLAWSAGYLRVEGEPRLALILEDSKLDVWEERNEQLNLVASEWADAYPVVTAVLTVPGELYIEAEQQRGRLGGAILESLGDLDHFYIERGPQREWSNQGAGFDRTRAPHVWNDMRFRSRSEVCIAQALERASATFSSNTVVRHGNADDRVSREVDFLVLDGYRRGILEVDGAPWHPPARAATEYGRDRRFKLAGYVVERFDANVCREDPDSVVAQFLRLLRLN